MVNNLAAYRKKAKLNQKEFADKLKVSTVTLSKWENPEFDLNELSVKTIIHICELLRISIKDLINI